MADPIIQVAPGYRSTRPKNPVIDNSAQPAPRTLESNASRLTLMGLRPTPNAPSTGTVTATPGAGAGDIRSGLSKGAAYPRLGEPVAYGMNNPAIKVPPKAVALAKTLGKVAGPVAVGMEGLRVYDEGFNGDTTDIDKASALAAGAGRWGSAGVGATYGGAIAGPVGALAGGAAGYFLGDNAIKVGRRTFGSDPTPGKYASQAEMSAGAAPIQKTTVQPSENFPTKDNSLDPDRVQPDLLTLWGDSEALKADFTSPLPSPTAMGLTYHKPGQAISGAMDNGRGGRGTVEMSLSDPNADPEWQDGQLRSATVPGGAKAGLDRVARGLKGDHSGTFSVLDNSEGRAVYDRLAAQRAAAERPTAAPTTNYGMARMTDALLDLINKANGIGLQGNYVNPNHLHYQIQRGQALRALRALAPSVASMYGADRGVDSAGITADRGLAASRYTADQNVQAHRYTADAHNYATQMGLQRDYARMQMESSDKAAERQKDLDVARLGLRKSGKEMYVNQPVPTGAINKESNTPQYVDIPRHINPDSGELDPTPNGDYLARRAASSAANMEHAPTFLPSWLGGNAVHSEWAGPLDRLDYAFDITGNRQKYDEAWAQKATDNYNSMAPGMGVDLVDPDSVWVNPHTGEFVDRRTGKAVYRDPKSGQLVSHK